MPLFQDLKLRGEEEKRRENPRRGVPIYLGAVGHVVLRG
jgi:hypothetical protein